MLHIWLLVFTLQEKTLKEEEIALIAYVTLVLLLLFVMIIVFFTVFQKRKTKLLKANFRQQKEFDEAISRTQSEIQEQTLKHVSWELHDNVGQLLAYANMQLNMLAMKAPDSLKDKISETTSIVQDSLKEVRSLSKSLNNDVILENSLESIIQNELDRLKRMKFSSAVLEVKGDKNSFRDPKHGVILFRILQEFFSNSVKYSEAEHIKVLMEYQSERLLIKASDDGKGFDINLAEKGSGLINMKSRAELIGSNFNIESTADNGVQLTIQYPFV